MGCPCRPPFYYIFLLVGFFAIRTSGTVFRWNDDNCPVSYGDVTDAVCCQGESFCVGFSDRKSCHGDGDEAGLYCQWSEGECLPKRDGAQNVCCRSNEGSVKDLACHNITQGLCPQAYQVDANCCQKGGAKWASVLKSAPGKVCCNTPCADAESMGCEATPQCGPTQRSYAMFSNPVHQLGFSYGGNKKMGNVIYGTGYGMDLGWASPLSKYDSSKDKHVDEITVDDVMELLIESLEKDEDLVKYSAEYSSDPYMGKQKSGGLMGSMNLPDADVYLDRIYGSQYGMGVGAYPQYSMTPGMMAMLGMSGSYGMPGYYGGYGSTYGPSYGGGYRSTGGYGPSQGYGGSFYGYGGPMSPAYGQPYGSTVSYPTYYNQGQQAGYGGQGSGYGYQSGGGVYSQSHQSYAGDQSNNYGGQSYVQPGGPGGYAGSSGGYSGGQGGGYPQQGYS